MREEAERRGLTVQIGYMLRYNPAFELLSRAAREGWFGEITEIDASMGKLAADAQRAALRAYPGGGIFELACHLVDAVVTLLGKPDAVHSFDKRRLAVEISARIRRIIAPAALTQIAAAPRDAGGGRRRVRGWRAGVGSRRGKRCAAAG